MKKGPLENKDYQARTAEQQALRRAQNTADIGTLLKQPAGRRFIYSVIYERCGVDAKSFTGDPLTMSMREGRRDVGIALKGEITEEYPDLFLEMWGEAINRSKDETLDRKDAEASARKESES